MNTPPVSQSPRRRTLLQPALWLAALLALIVTVKLAFTWRLPVPFCPLRTLTGVPCPLCGSTRALLALAQLDFAAAFRFNPLFAIVCAGVLLVFTVSLVERCLARDWVARAKARLRWLPLKTVLLVVLAMNWVYLFLARPR